jgi:hypothetical protein
LTKFSSVIFLGFLGVWHIHFYLNFHTLKP